MTEGKKDLLVTLVRKAVGMPTGASSCCSAPVAETGEQPVSSGSCCSTPAAETGEQAVTPAAGSCCGTDPAGTSDDAGSTKVTPAPAQTEPGCCGPKQG